MTTFRCSAALLAALVAACGNAEPLPSTELGRIVRIENYNKAADQLQRFAEARVAHPAALRTELENAGFKRSVFKDEPDHAVCERFYLKTTKGLFPSVYDVTICNGKVFASAGALAP